MEWWEKTVEYAFILESFRNGRCTFAAPLSGKEERSFGDAAFGHVSKYSLIEFKRDASCIRSEIVLFHHYPTAKSKIGNDEHHHIVYGKESDSRPGELELYAETYFSRKPRPNAIDSLDFGLDAVNFREYLILLAGLKKEDGRGSSGHVSPEALSTVLGVSSEGNVVSARPLYEYAPDLFPLKTLDLGNTPDDELSPPSHRFF